MLSAPQPAEPLVEDWIERHRHPASFVLHLFGIPPTILGTMLIPVYLGSASWSIFWLALGLFVGGYALQFLGHLCDWSEPGEITGLRQWLKRFLQNQSQAAKSAVALAAVTANAKTNVAVSVSSATADFV